MELKDLPAVKQLMDHLSRVVADITKLLGLLAIGSEKEAPSWHENFHDIHFDFYSETSYEFLSELAPPILVFTCHAIEQIPDATRVVRNLCRFSKVIKRVVHLEPTLELHGDSLLGIMRQRYAALNDYNRNLVSLLKPFGAAIKQDLFGINPLNPTSQIEWQPR